ncbi:MAG TPA: hypothetical protein VF006_05260 [Longimicrobium sp.]
MDAETWLPLLGHLLTAAAILISALGLQHAWHQHRDGKEREERNRFTVAAATSLAKLERRRQHYLDYFFHIRPHFITASESYTSADLWAPVRDSLWKEFEAEQSRTHRAQADEEIEVAYVTLAAFDAPLYSEFRSALAELDRVARDELRKFRDSSQNLLWEKREQPTASVSSALRKLAETHADQLSSKSEPLLADVRRRILALVQNPAATPLRLLR